MAKKKKKPPIHEELEGFDININSLGELESSLEIDKINDFLNKKLKDKKLPDDPEGFDYDEDEVDDDEWEEE